MVQDPVRVRRSEGTARRDEAAAVARVERAVRQTLGRAERVVLAVSGGRDSMVLLDAAARVACGRLAGVATFDHGTGPAAARAARLVARRARSLGLLVRRGRARAIPATEADWREARWAFLRASARATGAQVATAHTRDDQVETVLIRALRDAGARGLAALYADAPGVLRPLLAVSRADVAEYAGARAVRWVEDPSNASRAYLRNRIREDLLPAMEQARPGLSAELLALARRSAALRAALDAHVHAHVVHTRRGGVLAVARADLLDYDPAALRLLWPTLAARTGIVMDRRGTERVATFTITGRPGTRIQLAGGFEVVRQRDELIVRRVRTHDAPRTERMLALDDRVGAWRFIRDARGTDGGEGTWSALLPADAPARVRAWRPGDRMTPHGASVPRRVKGLFRDAGVDAGSRRGWPVVLVDGEIVWIPGVRRSSAATVRSGRPVVRYRCERHDS